MDLEEYRKRLGAEPRSEDAEMVEARRSSVQHRGAARQAEAFEARLEAALKLPARAGQADAVIASVCGDTRTEPDRRWQRWAVAAALVLSVGISAMLWRSTPPEVPLRDAFVAHLQHPEPAALTSTLSVDQRTVARTFARFGAELSDDVSNVTYLSRCKIGGKTGIHLVITNAAGEQTTVMYLSDENLDGDESFALASVTARLVAAPNGVLALFGHQGQDLSAISERLLSRLGASREASRLG